MQLARVYIASYVDNNEERFFKAVRITIRLREIRLSNKVPPLPAKRKNKNYLTVMRKRCKIDSQRNYNREPFMDRFPTNNCRETWLWLHIRRKR